MIVVAEAKRALYFGCRDANEPGHFLQEGRKTLWQAPPEVAFWSDVMDGTLLKNGLHADVIDGKVWWTCGGRRRENLWYAFFWWDRSGDRRPGSNSGFYVGGFAPEVLSPKTARENAAPAFRFACDFYPEVIARQRQPLVLQT
jgi:hypothetical protein